MTPTPEQVAGYKQIAISLRDMNTAMKGYCNLPIHDLPAPPDSESELLAASEAIEKLCDTLTLTQQRVEALKNDLDGFELVKKLGLAGVIVTARENESLTSALNAAKELLEMAKKERWEYAEKNDSLTTQLASAEGKVSELQESLNMYMKWKDEYEKKSCDLEARLAATREAGMIYHNHRQGEALGPHTNSDPMACIDCRHNARVLAASQRHGEGGKDEI